MNITPIISPEQRETFITMGFVHVEQAYPHDVALSAQQDVWKRVKEMGADPDDRTTWTKPMIHLTETYDTPAFRKCKTERLKQAVDELVGVGRWTTRETQDGWGWWPVNFGVGADADWTVSTNGWHWDGIHFQHSVDAPDQGLLLLCFFSDIASHGGATLAAAGSHQIVARFLASQKEPMQLGTAIKSCIEQNLWLRDLTGMLDINDQSAWPRDFKKWHESGDRVERFMNRSYVDEAGTELKVVETTGRAGDIYLCHPFLFHAAAPNTLRQPRFMCNRTTPLDRRLDVRRENPSPTLVEQAIINALYGSTPNRVAS